MPAQVFRNAEEAFTAWLLQNPNGFVVNAKASLSPSYFVLHRAHCTTLHRDVPPGGYTERDYIKVGASDATPSSLKAWVRQMGGPGFTKVCAVCKPAEVSDDWAPSEQLVGNFEEQVVRARQLTSAERSTHLPTQKTPPAFYVTTTIAFVRSPYVVAEVLERAAGHCERCMQPAPFVRAKDGTPYLEVHHKVRLADGGYDTVDNATALCPNCQRRSHHGHSDG